MGFTESSRFCSVCKKQVLVRQETPDHTVHALITLFSCGLWGLVWLLITALAMSNPWRCTQCGSPASNNEFAKNLGRSFRQIQPLGTKTGKPDAISTPVIVTIILLVGITLALVSTVLDKQKPASTTNSSVNPMISSTSTPSPTAPSQDDYQRGYKAGMANGKLIARADSEDGGVGTEEGLQQAARGEAILSNGEREGADWQRGWVDGYKKGYFSIRGTPNTEDLEALSWVNARPNVKLYNTSGRHVVTIISAHVSSGLITVRYVKDGTVEDKDLAALSSVWFVRKK